MNNVKSFFLEILRIASAFYVFIFHIESFTINNKTYFVNDNFLKSLRLNYYTAHNFVMIFFVLSGYLISISASKPNITFSKFIIARLGRLYSVVVPSLIFSFFVAFLLLGTTEIGHFITNTSNPFTRFGLNLIFLSQISTLCSTPPLNTPFWSVQYEFFYYLFLAVFLLVKKPYKYIFLLLLIVLSWPKILLLLPVWLFGCFLYFYLEKIKVSLVFAILLFASFFSVFCYFIVNPYSIPFQNLRSDVTLCGYSLYFSWNYISDYVFGISVMLTMFSFFMLSPYLNLLLENNKHFIYCFKKIKQIGNCTFTLYLFHLPLMFLITTVLPYNKNSFIEILLLIFSVLFLVFVIAKYTEWKVIFWRNKVLDFFLLLKKFIIQ